MDGLSPVCILVRSWGSAERYQFVQVRSGRFGTGRLVAGVVVSLDNPERGRVLAGKLVEWARAYYRVHLDDSALEWVNAGSAGNAPGA